MQYNSDGTEKVCALLQPKKAPAVKVEAPPVEESDEEVAALFKEPVNDRSRKQD